MTIPYATEKKTNFENFIATCPICNKLNIFNRATDLDTFEPIFFKQVICFHCKNKFNINGDSIASPFRYLLFDCYNLIEQKRYMFCILNLSLSFESFFSQFIRLILCLKPFKQNIIEDLEGLNSLLHLLYKKISVNFSYQKLRNTFINIILDDLSIQSFNEVESAIIKLDNLTETPSDLKLQKINDSRLRDLIIELKAFKINEMRNRIVHHQTYRPNLKEVTFYFDKSKDILFGLQSYFDIMSDNLYLNS